MGCRKRCVSSCCSCWYCWQWHLNVRIAPVLPGRIRAATWKSQYWLQLLTGLHRTSLFASPWASRHLPAPRDSHSSVRALWDPSTTTAVYKGCKHWHWELCHEPTVENKTSHLNQSPHTSACAQWQEMGKVNVTSGMLNLFLFRFLAVLPTLFWSGSVLLAATSIILSWNTSKAHISLLLPHRKSWMLSTSWTLMGFTPLPAHCRTRKRNSVEGTELLIVCPQNLKKN